MEVGVKRLVTPQETLLLHTIYKVMVSLIENQSTGDERQKLFEDVLDIPDERLIDFRDGRKLIRIKRHLAKGELTNLDAEANAWCSNVFQMVSEAYPLLKDIREFHNLLAATGIAATPETRP